MSNLFKQRKVVLFGVGSALLLLCLGVAAVLVVPLIASAHGSTATATPTPTTTGTYCQQYQQALAKRLGVSVDTLNSDRQGALSDVLAQMVKDGKLTQAQADAIKQKASAHSTSDCAGLNAHKGFGFANAPLLKKYGTDILAQVAQGLHLTSDQLTAQLQAGKSLNEIAQAQGVSSADLHTLVNKVIASELTKAVAAKDMTQQQADTITQFLQKHPNVLDKLFSQHKLLGKHGQKANA